MFKFVVTWSLNQKQNMFIFLLKNLKSIVFRMASVSAAQWRALQTALDCIAVTSKSKPQRFTTSVKLSSILLSYFSVGVLTAPCQEPFLLYFPLQVVFVQINFLSIFNTILCIKKPSSHYSGMPCKPVMFIEN